MDETLAAVPTRSPDYSDDFRDGLDAERWIAHYLPQWSSRAESTATWAVEDSALVLSSSPRTSRR